MRFFHISDLHIGKQLHRYSMRSEQEDILNKIVCAVKKEQPDAIAIAGDIYDKSVPSAEAVALFDHFLTVMKEQAPQVPLLIIAGNHDSAERLDYARELLTKNQVYISGMPPRTEGEYLKKVTLQDAYGAVNFYLMPFIKPFFVRSLLKESDTLTYDEAVRGVLAREQIDRTERNVILSHQFYVAGGSRPKTSESEIAVAGGIDEVDVSVLAPFDYAALGHIHRPQKIGKEQYRYCGTPLKYSVSEEHQAKSITCVELKEKGTEPVITQIGLEPLRELRSLRGTLSEVLSLATEENKDDFLSITLTDEIDPYQPKERLMEVYSHILEVRVDNARTRRILSEEVEELKLEDPVEVFAQFFENMQARPMSEAERRVMIEIFAKAAEGEVNG